MTVAVSSPDLIRAAFALEMRDESPEGRVVHFSFSSEAPYLREDGWEILGHQKGECDLSRLVAGSAPLLKDHRRDVDSIVGRVESAQFIGGRGKAMVRFSDTDEGNKMLARVRAGDIGSVSAGYQTQERAHIGERDGLPVFRATHWTPYEISLVAIPADPTVGIGRSASGSGANNAKLKDSQMTTETQTPEIGATRAAVKAERTRISEIRAIGSRFDIDAAEVDDAIDSGTSVDRFRSLAMDLIGKRDPRRPLPPGSACPRSSARVSVPIR